MLGNKTKAQLPGDRCPIIFANILSAIEGIVVKFAVLQRGKKSRHRWWLITGIIILITMRKQTLCSSVQTAEHSDNNKEKKRNEDYWR